MKGLFFLCLGIAQSVLSAKIAPINLKPLFQPVDPKLIEHEACKSQLARLNQQYSNLCDRQNHLASASNYLLELEQQLLVLLHNLSQVDERIDSLGRRQLDSIQNKNQLKRISSLFDQTQPSKSLDQGPGGKDRLYIGGSGIQAAFC